MSIVVIDTYAVLSTQYKITSQFKAHHKGGTLSFSTLMPTLPQLRAREIYHWMAACMKHTLVGMPSSLSTFTDHSDTRDNPPDF